MGLFGATVAWTGANEQTLARAGMTDYEKIHIFPNSHAGYYPGAKPISMKVIFRKSDGRLLGAQAVGEDGVDKRISHLAMALQMGATVYDLEEAELCYAPPFGSAKDPVNFAGMVGADVLRGDMPLRHWDSVDGAFILDVREKPELAVEHVPGAVNIPLGQLRARLDELPRDREDPGALPVRPTRVLRDARAPPAWVRRPGDLGRHAVARDPSGGRTRGASVTGAAPDREASGAAVACTTEQLQLGEGARWDARRDEFLHVDILTGRVFRDRVEDDGRLTRIAVHRVPGTVGAIAPVDCDDGWLLAAGRGFVHLRPDGSVRQVADVAPAGTRMNDAACDPSGRLWAGTLADDHHIGGGALFRLDRTGRTEQMLDGGWAASMARMTTVERDRVVG